MELSTSIVAYDVPSRLFLKLYRKAPALPMPMKWIIKTEKCSTGKRIVISQKSFATLITKIVESPEEYIREIGRKQVQFLIPF